MWWLWWWLHALSPCTNPPRPNPRLRRGSPLTLLPQEDLENGVSVLDGILPVDPKFGQLEGDLGLGDLLGDGKLVNGHMTDYSKMNGEKRSAEVENHPAKRQALEGVVTNGVVASNGVNGGGMRVGGNQGMVIVSQGQQQSQQAMQGQLVKSSTGQLFLKTTSSSGNAVLVPAGQQTQQGQVLVQQPGQQKLMLVNQGGRQVVVGGQQAQQSVVRVSAPMAAVPQGDQHVTQIDGAEEPLPQLDGVEDCLPQLDGTGDELPPAPAVPAAGAPPPAAGAPPSPSVSEGSGSAEAAPPAAPHTANGRSTPSSSATPPPCSPTPSPSPPPSQPAIKIDTTKPFLCEWAGCMKAYKTPKEVENHAIAEHCPIGSDDVPCLWARCDGMRRKRFSLMTHLQDRHCHPQVRRRSRSRACLAADDQCNAGVLVRARWFGWKIGENCCLLVVVLWRYSGGAVVVVRWWFYGQASRKQARLTRDCCCMFPLPPRFSVAGVVRVGGGRFRDLVAGVSRRPRLEHSTARQSGPAESQD